LPRPCPGHVPARARRGGRAIPSDAATCRHLRFVNRRALACAGSGQRRPA
jgi:hypothetical protein